MSGSDGANGHELLAEQRAFYRAQAEQFDGWLSTLVDERNDHLDARTYRAGRRRIADHFRQRAHLGHVLEIAAGTGRLAELYLPHAASVVLLDSSPESLALAARRLSPRAGADITLAEADVFAWDGHGRAFDTILFSAWLHHVPHSRFEHFWRIIDRLLAKSGEVIFDFPDAGVPSSGLTDMPDEPTPGYSFYAPVDGISLRDHDGRRWRVVHNLWEPAELSARLAGAGWHMEPIGTGLFADVVWATARR
jgi:SAM-dependent methyltransferase